MIFMPRYPREDGSFYAPPDIIRFFRLMSGEPKFKIKYDPKLDFAREKTYNENKGEYIKHGICAPLNMEFAPRGLKIFRYLFAKFYENDLKFKEFKDGTIKELIGQCKHPMISKKPIGPDVIRELIGAATLEESEHEKVLMVITSSIFTIGARKAAQEKNIELVDGDDLLK